MNRNEGPGTSQEEQNLQFYTAEKLLIRKLSIREQIFVNKIFFI